MCFSAFYPFICVVTVTFFIAEKIMNVFCLKIQKLNAPMTLCVPSLTTNNLQKHLL
jgi:hypothetical protein